MITIQEKIKEVPGLAYVVENMELMSSAGRRRMLEQPFLSSPQDLEHEQTTVATLRERLAETSYTQPLIVLRHQLMQLHDLRTTLNSLRSHFILDEVELFEIKNLAFLCGHSRKALADMHIDNLFNLFENAVLRFSTCLTPTTQAYPTFIFTTATMPVWLPCANR